MKNINSEKDFEKEVSDIIKGDILVVNKNLLLLDNKKSVDILVCRNGTNSKLFFIEIKYHKINHGRLGFGHEKGAGFQPELLMRRPDYFESNLRWIIGSEESDSFFLLDNEQILNYIQGGKIDTKFNGLQKKLFKEIEKLDRAQLGMRLLYWFDN
jgi:hypothetical protein